MMIQTKALRTLVVALGVFAFALTGCSTSPSKPEENGTNTGGAVPQGDEISTTVDAELTKLLPDEIVNRGVLNVAVDIPFPPMAMYDEHNREVGFDPELARLLGQKLGVEISINKQAFDSVIPSLQAGKNDIIMSGMNDTPERQEVLTFVDYTYGGFAILVQSGNPEGIKTQRDLCGLTVSVQKATVQGDLLRKMDCDVNVTELPLDVDAQTALRAGKSHAYVADAVVAEYVAATTGNGKTFEVVRDPENPAGFSPVYSGIGILKTETELIEAIRAAFQALIDEGTYQAVLDRNNIASYAVESAEINQGTTEL